MAEFKLFDGDRAQVSTFAFHENRERAAHLEDPTHAPRLAKAAQYVRDAADQILDRRMQWAAPPDRSIVQVTDLGCGDGGLLQLLKLWPDDIQAWGYDFAPANANGWRERGVTAYAHDFVNNSGAIMFGQIVVMTEVLEHLTDPHGMLERLWYRDQVDYLVVSSPWTEHSGSHDACHAWAWDREGYEAMLNANGWDLVTRTSVGMFQAVLAKRGHCAP